MAPCWTAALMSPECATAMGLQARVIASLHARFQRLPTPPPRSVLSRAAQACSGGAHHALPTVPRTSGPPSLDPCSCGSRAAVRKCVYTIPSGAPRRRASVELSICRLGRVFAPGLRACRPLCFTPAAAVRMLCNPQKTQSNTSVAFCNRLQRGRRPVREHNAGRSWSRAIRPSELRKRKRCGDTRIQQSACLGRWHLCLRQARCAFASARAGRVFGCDLKLSATCSADGAP